LFVCLYCIVLFGLFAMFVMFVNRLKVLQFSSPRLWERPRGRRQN
jgi:hypothetical protein